MNYIRKLNEINPRI